MKVFAFIYAFYMLMLPILPCGDKEDCSVEKTKSSLVKSIDVEHQNHEHEDENCSPFCTCMCCGQTISNLFYTVKQQDNNQLFVTKNTAIYKNTFHLSSYLDSIWQPPKFS